MRRIAAALAVIAMVSLAAPIVRATELTFALKIEHGQVPANMRLIRVMQGDLVKLAMLSDRRLLIHLHGYEIMAEVKPDTPSMLFFTANLTGRFPIHLHAGPAEADGHAHEETLVTIEVYPR